MDSFTSRTESIFPLLKTESRKYTRLPEAVFLKAEGFIKECIDQENRKYEQAVPENSNSRLNQTRKRNGYTLITSLVILMLMMSVCMLVSLQNVQSALFLGCMRQSKLDLAILDQAKEMASQAAYSKRCSSNSQDESESSDSAKNQNENDKEKEYVRINIMNIPVFFCDLDTCIQAEWKLKEKEYKCLVYYDSNGILNVQFEAI